MTRAQFLNDLYHYLRPLGQEQAEQHLTYYAEMLADRMEEGMSEEEAVASMEPVDVIAQRILQDEGVPEGQPPRWPDLPETDGSRFTKTPDFPKRKNWRKLTQILLWAAAIAAAVSAVGRWRAQNISSTIAESSDAPPIEDVVDWRTHNDEECGCGAAGAGRPEPVQGAAEPGHRGRHALPGPAKAGDQGPRRKQGQGH